MDNLSFVTGLPWKHNVSHEVGEEVMLDTEPAEPPPTPVCSPLPPRMLNEPIKDLRGFYVKIPDLDPAAGGIGFTDGCKGCKAIIHGKSRVGHDNHCRHRVVETASTNPDVAVRVKIAIDRDVKWHAKKLEESETRRKEPEKKTGEEAVARSDPQVGSEAHLPTGKRKSDHQEDEGRVPNQIGGGSPSSQVVAARVLYLKVCSRSWWILKHG